jgi:hypothetical protein
MAPGNLSPEDVVPSRVELSSSAVRWHEELQVAVLEKKRQDEAFKAAFEAEKKRIDESFEEKRREQISKLNADIHQYMTMVQQSIDGLLHDLKSHKLESLEREYREKKAERDKAHEHELFGRLDRIRNIYMGESDPAVRPFTFVYQF